MIINGKEAKFFWGSSAFISYQNAILSNEGEFSAFSVPSIAHILWGGILNHCQRTYEKCPFTFTEIYDHVEDIAVSGKEDKEVNECIKEFNDSVFVKKAVEDLNKDEKKSSVKKISKKLPLKQD